MKIPAIELCPTDPLKHFGYIKNERPDGCNANWPHPLDRLFLNDPIRHNLRQAFRLSIPIMRSDDRAAACEVMAAMLLAYKMTDNHARMIDYAHTVRLYDEIQRHALRIEPRPDPGDEI